MALEDTESQILRWIEERTDTEDLPTLTDIPARRIDYEDTLRINESAPAEALRMVLFELQHTFQNMPMGESISSDFILGFRRGIELSIDIVDRRLLPWELSDLAEILPNAEDELVTQF